MSSFALPPEAVPAEIPRTVHLQIVSPSAEPPASDGWLHEVKHDGHRLVAIVAGNDLKLVSRNGYDRTALFREPFEKLAGLPPLVLDCEIAAPDAGYHPYRSAVRGPAPAAGREPCLFAFDHKRKDNCAWMMEVTAPKSMPGERCIRS